MAPMVASSCAKQHLAKRHPAHAFGRTVLGISGDAETEVRSKSTRSSRDIRAENAVPKEHPLW
eukprot:scaffold5354_cov200-Pinguiococcus_pyrenoidosus.AAC.1